MQSLGEQIAVRCKCDSKFKAQVLKSLYQKLSNKKLTAAYKVKVLRAVQMLEKLQ